MKINYIKLIILLLIFSGAFYFLIKYFDSLLLGFLGIIFLFLMYAVILFFIRKSQAKGLNKKLAPYVDKVPHEISSSEEPHILGIIKDNERRLFLRISVNLKGIFIYKFKSLSIRIPLDKVIIEKSNNLRYVRVIFKHNRQINFLMPWNREFDKEVKKHF